MDREIPKEEIRRNKLKRWGKIIAGVTIAIAIVAITLATLRKSISSSDLRLSTADRGTLETTVNASGRFEPAFEQIIVSPISTTIMEVYCKEGDSVATGTPLLRLDLQTAETELRRLENERQMKHLDIESSKLKNRTYLDNLAMQIKVKEMTLSRLATEVANEKRLDSLGSGTGDKVREAELAYNTGSLELAQLRHQLQNERQSLDASIESEQLSLDISHRQFEDMSRTVEDARIKSPREATLTYINNQIGKQIGAGEKVAVISDLSHFKVAGEIADTYGDKIAVGAPVTIKIGKLMLNGHVSNVTPLSKNGVISFSITLEQDDHPRLRSGLRADIYLLTDIKDDVVRIANGSYYKGAGEYDLFVVTSDNELKKRHVKLGDCNYQYVEVISGIEPGDKVAVNDMSDFTRYNNIKINK